MCNGLQSSHTASLANIEPACWKVLFHHKSRKMAKPSSLLQGFLGERVEVKARSEVFDDSFVKKTFWRWCYSRVRNDQKWSCWELNKPLGVGIFICPNYRHDSQQHVRPKFKVTTKCRDSLCRFRESLAHIFDAPPIPTASMNCLEC